MPQARARPGLRQWRDELLRRLHRERLRDGEQHHYHDNDDDYYYYDNDNDIPPYLLHFSGADVRRNLLRRGRLRRLL